MEDLKQRVNYQPRGLLVLNGFLYADEGADDTQ